MVLEYLMALEEYFWAIGLFIGLFLLMLVFRVVVYQMFKRASEKTKFKLDDMIISFLDGIGWPFYAYLSLYVVSKFIEIPLLVNQILDTLFILFIGYYLGKAIAKVVKYVIKKKVKKDGDPSGESMIKVFSFLIQIIIWLIVLLMALANLGVEITPLIMSLGVGGIAIALALQSILGDLFAAFAMYFDKPFVEGDFIIIGNDMGVVKNIGIKTTRIQTLSGQELSISNSELTNARVNNYKRMEERRVVFKFGVTYDTKTEKLEKAKQIVTEVVKNVKDARLDRVHFFNFGDFSLNFEVVYYVNTNDYNKYMDVQEQINLGIKREFEKEKIEFAYPTQTVYLEK
jgi:small-conductance mechanosensitive channel